MAWRIVKEKETSCSAICLQLKNVNCEINLPHKMISCEVSVTILASLEQYACLTKNHDCVFESEWIRHTLHHPSTDPIQA